MSVFSFQGLLCLNVQYSSSETNFSGNLTIGNTKHCQILYTGVYNDNTDDDTVPEMITSEYVIRAYDIDYSDVAAIESVANITVTNTTSPSPISNSPSTEQPTITSSNTTTDNTTDINECMIIIIADTIPNYNIYLCFSSLTVQRNSYIRSVYLVYLIISTFKFH